MTLSSSETEWVSLSEDDKELFVTQLLGRMKISVKLSVIVSVDDVGAIFIACNITAMLFTKHLDINTIM